MRTKVKLPICEGIGSRKDKNIMTRKKIAILSLVIYTIAFYVIVSKINPPSKLTVAYYEKYTIQANDSLWGIAEQYNHGKDIRKFIYIIKDNNKISSNLQIGEEILIPILEQ